MTRYLFVASLFGVMAVGLMTAIGARADGSGEPSENEIRINLLRRDDGDVVVAVQQRDPEGRWGDRQRPRLNRLRADAPTGHWHASSALTLRSEPAPAGQFYTLRTIGPARSLNVAQYLSFCSDISDQGESVAAFLTSAAHREPTWAQFSLAVDALVGSLRAVEPPEALSSYHAALTRLAISTAQYAVLQPGDEIVDFADLVVPFSLDGPALESAERSLDEELAFSMRDAGCIE